MRPFRHCQSLCWCNLSFLVLFCLPFPDHHSFESFPIFIKATSTSIMAPISDILPSITKASDASSHVAPPAIVQQTIPYLSLPAEIRNQIMEAVLVIGEVTVQRKPTKLQDLDHARSSPKNDISLKMSSRAPSFAAKCIDGYPFLATCRQVYEEGRALFFSKNTFRLPAGPVEDSRAWLEGIQPKNQLMLSSLNLSLSIEDTTQDKIDQLYRLDLSKTWDSMIEDHIYKLWREKLELLICWGQVIRIDKGKPSRTTARLREPDDEPGRYTDDTDVRIFDHNGEVEAPRTFFGMASHFP